MEKVSQRYLDFAKIKELCKFYSSDKCPLVFKTCNVENCPLFIVVTLKDCDDVVSFIADDVF